MNTPSTAGHHRNLITAKENGMSAHGLISGVILAALRARLELATEPITLAVSSPIDLRHRLSPSVAPDAQLCGASAVVVFVTAPHPADPLALGRQVTTRVHTAIDNGDPQKWVTAMSHPDLVLRPSTSAIVSSRLAGHAPYTQRHPGHRMPSSVDLPRTHPTDLRQHHRRTAHPGSGLRPFVPDRSADDGAGRRTRVDPWDGEIRRWSAIWILQTRPLRQQCRG
jgi:hypothetical protein